MADVTYAWPTDKDREELRKQKLEEQERIKESIKTAEKEKIVELKEDKPKKKK